MWIPLKESCLCALHLCFWEIVSYFVIAFVAYLFSWNISIFIWSVEQVVDSVQLWIQYDF